jgi:hypothetical protein
MTWGNVGTILMFILSNHVLQMIYIGTTDYIYWHCRWYIYWHSIWDILALQMRYISATWIKQECPNTLIITPRFCLISGCDICALSEADMYLWQPYSQHHILWLHMSRQMWLAASQEDIWNLTSNTSPCVSWGEDTCCYCNRLSCLFITQ